MIGLLLVLIMLCMYFAYYQALELCVKLEAIYEEESAKEGGPKSEPAGKEDSADEGSEEEDEDDDKVFLEDFAEVKLLQAILHGAIEDEQSTSASFTETLALFEKALGTKALSCLRRRSTTTH